MNTGVLRLENISSDDLHLFGGKAINLSVLLQKGFNVPFGVALSKGIFEKFLEHSGLEINSIRQVHTLAMISLESVLHDCYQWECRILNSIETVCVPEYLIQEIMENLDESSEYAVRSSCISEDSSSTSFAGQYVSFLHIKGKENILSAVKKCWASQYSKRGNSYAMNHKGMPIISPSMGVVIQEMVHPDFAGVCFTQGPTPKTSDFAIIEYVDCIGEVLVSGERTPDHIEIDKQNIIRKRISSGKNKKTLNDILILKLLEVCRRIENDFNAPQDIEWAIIGEEIYILQTRPITILGKETTGNTSQKLYLSHSAFDLKNELHDLILSEIDSSGFRGANYFLCKQHEQGFWSNPEIPEWDTVGTAESVYLLYKGGIPANMIWENVLEGARTRFGISLAQKWLLQKAGTDGNWGTDLWDTCQVLISLITTGMSPDAVQIKNGISYVKSHFEKGFAEANNNEWYGAAFLASSLKLFHLIKYKKECTQCIDLLRKYQDEEGNFYINTAQNQNVPSEWHTAQVISALCFVNESNNDILQMINKSCKWLVTKQNKEGFWGVKEGAYSPFNITFTSYAIMALKDSGINYNGQISKAIKWIKTQQNLNGNFGDIWSTMMALSAIQKVTGSLFSFPIPLPVYIKLQKAILK
ncbi:MULTISPECIES: PEP/pyruvate-binding domain-containing protein [unclassified Chryseobacterium]|uniref:PEP/pyruvate-binding domain-containing protein n=1 Tax=unclassified Chryseobacterium TaxID=2593645 RepID=UPI000D377290|nr:MULTISPECIES: PEP/pyruvate-binding domain-containing protein [unclassified Chryseobacterium]PTT66766.1 hypothetical protein DBR25_22010 [Chryseobacterium sp. HMWF001]PVV55188.1 hypothetical protein DD829_15530 [Chryseobacterium sp. HMWF035]